MKGGIDTSTSFCGKESCSFYTELLIREHFTSGCSGLDFNALDRDPVLSPTPFLCAPAGQEAAGLDAVTRSKCWSGRTVSGAAHSDTPMEASQ